MSLAHLAFLLKSLAGRGLEDPHWHEQEILKVARRGRVCDPDLRPFVRRGVIGRSQQTIPHAEAYPEVPVEMTRLDRMVNPMEAVVHQQLAQRPERDVDRRVNQVRKQHHEKADDSWGNRMVELDKAHGERDEKQMGPDLGGVADVVCCVKVGRCMMDCVYRPEPLMFSAVAAIDQEVRSSEKNDSFKGISGDAIRR